MDRSKKIIRTSILGIGANLVLVAFKAAVGLITGSIAVILDAVNNLSDALSSVITIIGTAISGKKPDKEHPFGHGRVEYLTSAVIAVIVLVAGITSLKESVEAIITPPDTSYSTVSLIIIAAAIGVKLFMGFYVKKVGNQLNSGSLIASGSDALFDAVLSVGTLAAAALSLIWGWKLEGVFGALISVFIIKSGIEILTDTLSSIIGTRGDKELSDEIREILGSFDEVRGVYDLTLHNYGPLKIIGTAHVELPAEMTAAEIHPLTRKMTLEVYEKLGVILTVGIYSSAGTDERSNAIRRDLEQAAKKYPEILQIHAFNTDLENGKVNYDLVIDFDADAEAIRDKLGEDMKKLYPELDFFAILDSDYSD